MNQSSMQNQRGAALVISLIFLVVVTALVVTSMRGSNLQERMTSNLNHKAMSFMIAEVGGSDLVAVLRSEEFWEGDVVQSLLSEGGDAAELTEILNNEIARSEDGLNVSLDGPIQWDSEESQLIAIIRGESLAGDDIAGQSRIRLTITEEINERINEAFEQGLLSNRDIDVSGQLTMVGSAHANRNFRATSAESELIDQDDSTSTISAVGEVEFEGDFSGEGELEERLSPGSDVVDVPSALEIIGCYVGDQEVSEQFPGEDDSRSFQEYCDDEVKPQALDYQFDADDVVEMTNGSSCDIDPEYSESSGGGGNTVVDLLGFTHFCDGDFDGGNTRYKNGVVMATGDITVRGGSGAGDEEEVLTTAFYAGGDITLRGSSVLSGLFFGDGQVRQSGTSTVRGTVISGGGYELEESDDDSDIDVSGNLRYEQVSDFGDLAGEPITERSGRVAGWTEVVFDD